MIRVDASVGRCDRQSSEQFAERGWCLEPNRDCSSRSMLVGSTDAKQMNGCPNNSAGGAPSNDNRKLKNRNKATKFVRVRRHDSIVGDAGTSSDLSSTTNVVPPVVSQVGPAPSNTGTPELRASNACSCGCQMTGGRPLAFPSALSSTFHELPDRRSAAASTSSRNSTDTPKPWDSKASSTNGSRHSAFPSACSSSLRELPGSAASSTAGAGRGAGGVGRRSRLDRHVYQCYLAGILHSSHRSERFVRLQQLYAALENVVEIESEMSSFRQGATPPATADDDRRRIMHAGDPAGQKLWRQRSLELQKLYAKLNTAQDQKEFFYDSGHLDAFQWKLWRDLGLNRKSAPLMMLRDLFEATAVFRGCSTVATPTSLQRFERDLSYRKLLGTFRCLEKKAMKEAEAWQSSSRQSVAAGVGAKLDGTYIKLMESAARNAKSLALHGYHMNEHRNRYDTYVQSRRIYRPTSAPNIFDQLDDDDPPEMDEVASGSDRTTSTVGFADGSRCGGERTVAKPTSESTDSLQVLSPSASTGREPISSASSQYQEPRANAGHPSEQQPSSPVVLPAAAAVKKESFSKVVNCDAEIARHQIATDYDHDVGANVPDAAVKHDGGSRNRKRHRRRCRNGNGTVVQRADTLDVVPSSAARRHIEAWRRSSRPLSGTLNQALAYFNSLCIDDSADTSDRRNSEATMSPSGNYKTPAQVDFDDVSSHLTSSSVSTENEKIPAAQFAGKKLSPQEIQRDVNGDESAVVPGRRKIVLPQMWPSRDEVCAAVCSRSGVSGLPPPPCSRAVNIDKRRSEHAIDSTQSDSDRCRHSAQAETADVRPLSLRSDVTATPGVVPTYVRSAPVVRMRSESQPTATSGSSPMFVDCRRAVVRTLPTVGDANSCRRSVDHSDTNDDSAVPSTSKPGARTDRFASGKLTNSDDETTQVTDDARRLKSEANEASVVSAADAAKKSSLSEDLYRRNPVMYVSVVDSSSFICGRCCRSLAACVCAPTTQTGSIRGSDNRSDSKYYVDHRSGKTAAQLKSDDCFAPAGGRSARDFYLPDRRSKSEAGEVGVVVMAGAANESRLPGQRPVADSRYGGPRPAVIVDGRRGRTDAELRRMMDSLETIDSEWTSGRPTRSTQHLVQSAASSDVNNNNSSSSSSSNQRRRVTDARRGRLNQREICGTLLRNSVE